MEVKVQYTVELDDIPKEVQSLLPSCEDFWPQIANAGCLIDEGSYSLGLEEIEKVRREMYKVDQRLADCQAILKGYLNVKNNPMQPNQDVDLESLQGMLQPSEEGVEDDSAS